MAITTKAGLLAAMTRPQHLLFTRNLGSGSGAFTWQTTFSAGPYGGGTLPGTSTTAGVVPTDATTGFPTIQDFPGGQTGYLAGIEAGAGVPAPNATYSARMIVFDHLFKAGAYSFNSNVALSLQPSYASRVPNSDYKGTQIWVECVTAFTGSPTFTITYTNQDGVAGKVATLSGAAYGNGRVAQVPLASGDTGVQKIENVACSVATVGTFNVAVIRPLWIGKFLTNSLGVSQGPDLVQLPIVFSDSALFAYCAHDFNSIVTPWDLDLTVIYG